MSKRIFCVGSISHCRQVVAGWNPAGQHFSVEVTDPGDVWLNHLDDAYRSADDAPAVRAGFTLHEVKAQLAARGIEAPEGFLDGLLSDAQANV